MEQITFNGRIEVVCGPMFAGKTEELLRRIKRLEFAKKSYIVFKPSVDNRHSVTEIVSHNNNRHQTYSIDNSKIILNYVNNSIDAIIIDEAQFFDNGIIDVVEQVANMGIRVIVGGLDLTFKGEPFGPMPQLLALAEVVTKLTAICVISGEPATRTQRLIDGKPAKYSDPIVLIGAEESYEPRARKYHDVPKD